MHKARAYEVLSRELQRWSSLSTPELAARIGEPPFSIFATAGAEQVQVEIAVAWADAADREFILITGRALGPSHWQFQRLEESVKVRVDP
jgi:hypothetical protein